MIPQACIYIYKKESKPPTTLTQSRSDSWPDITFMSVVNTVPFPTTRFKCIEKSVLTWGAQLVFLLYCAANKRSFPVNPDRDNID